MYSSRRCDVVKEDWTEEYRGSHGEKECSLNKLPYFEANQIAMLWLSLIPSMTGALQGLGDLFRRLTSDQNLLQTTVPAYPVK